MTRVPARPVTLISEMKPTLTKEEVSKLWRDEEKERKRSQHYKGNRLLRKDIQRRLKNGEKIPHRQQWVGKLPEFPIYGDREGSFQADCMFLPRTKGYVGCLCLISDNRKIAWAEAFKGNTPDEGGQKTKRIRAGQMFPYFVKCVEEIEKRFHVPVQRVESDDETMFKGSFQEDVAAKGIHWYFVKPSVSGPLKTKVGIVERFNRTLKSIINRLIDEYDLPETAWLNLLPEALHRYNYENIHREVGKTPAETTNEDEQKFIDRKKRQTQQTQEWWDIEVNGKTRGRRPHDENQKDAFRKEKKKFHKEVYTFTKRAAGPSMDVTNSEGHTISRRLLPYNVSWI